METEKLIDQLRGYYDSPGNRIVVAWINRITVGRERMVRLWLNIEVSSKIY